MTQRVTAGTMRLVHTIDNFLKITPPESNKVVSKRNKYDLYRAMTEFDNELEAARIRISAVVKKAYAGVSMKPDGNEALLEDVKEVLAELQFDRFLGFIIQDLIKDGDVILSPKNIKGSGDPLVKLMGGVEPLPINILTIVENEMPASVADDRFVIRNRDKYLLNESKNNVYKRDNNFVEMLDGGYIWHMSLNYHTAWVTDIMGRATFGVWSISPLESLKAMIRWKFQSIRDDVAWRHANVPRFDHTVDMSAVLDINDYTGSTDERITSAQAAGQDLLDAYRDSLITDDSASIYPGRDVDVTMDVDQGFIHDDLIKIAQVGGHNTYADCLPIVQKVDQSIAAKLGVPLSALGYEEGSTYAIGRVTVTFMNTFGTFLLSGLETGTFDFIRRILESRKKIYSPEDWDNIFLDYNVTDFEELKLTIDAWKGAYEGGIVTLGEAREALGKPPLEESAIDEDPINNSFHPGLKKEPSTMVNVSNPPTGEGAEGAVPKNDLRKDMDLLKKSVAQNLEEYFKAV